jgi:membrane associated rhomboid family serine protease
MIPISDVNRRTRFPFVNTAFIAINLLVYFYQVQLSGNFNLSRVTPQLASFFDTWAVIPAEYTQGLEIGPTPQPVFLTLFTAMFMHGNLLHIASNMLFLWVFGDNVESNMGHLKYLVFYLITGVLASGAHILFNLTSDVPSLGASGAISGVLAAYMVLFPRAQVRTLVIFFIITIIAVPAVFVIGLWFLTQLVQGVTELGAEGQTSGVAFWAHIGGFVAGLLLVFVFRGPRKPFVEGAYLPPGQDTWRR